MPNAPHGSIRFWLAREAPVGVLLRRGPSRIVQLLHWNLETDEVTPGQWLKARVHEQRCDLSPNGKLFAYFACNYEPKTEPGEYCYTAVSRPPYFTALALWFKGPSYNGGALFESDDKLLINALSDHEYARKFAEPKLRVGSFRLPPEDAETKRMIRDGWQMAKMAEEGLAIVEVTDQVPTYVPRIMVKFASGYSLSEKLAYRRQGEERTCTASYNSYAIDMEGANQVEIDEPRSRIVYTVGGKLLTHDGTSVKEIADLTHNSFEPVPPPDWATTWP